MLAILNVEKSLYEALSFTYENTFLKKIYFLMSHYS